MSKGTQICNDTTPKFEVRSTNEQSNLPILNLYNNFYI